ncbi:MAG: hypothetical protein MI756_13995, partial [Chromatiales bacterium]|nr:hypothetical protein [Chromatiales bacterium]
MDTEYDIKTQLWHLLPQVYRERDSGDLARFIGVLGHLLDGLYQGLSARYEDMFPDNCQPWLLPYIAQLLDARLVSPTTAGQRLETARAMTWRKQKGTLAAARDIARSVLRPPADQEWDRVNIHVREAWKHLARTPHLNMPLPTPGNAGPAMPEHNARTAARLPGLPQGTLFWRDSPIGGVDQKGDHRGGWRGSGALLRNYLLRTRDAAPRGWRRGACPGPARAGEAGERPET